MNQHSIINWQMSKGLCKLLFLLYQLKTYQYKYPIRQKVTCGIQDYVKLNQVYFFILQSPRERAW